MGEKTEIAWCDHTFNAWWGCTKVSPGCEHCYAATLDKRVGGAHWGPRAERRFFGDARWNEPVHWNRKAEKAGVRRRVFCGSMCDVGEDRPDLAPHRERLGRLIMDTPALDWLLLTKRPENMARLFSTDVLRRSWIGTTAEDQPRADERIPPLLACPAAVRFLSYEPALGPIVIPPRALTGCAQECTASRIGDCERDGTDTDEDGEPLTGLCPKAGDADTIDLVIAGSESGPGARPSRVEWFRSLRDQCVAAGAKFFFKQWTGPLGNGIGASYATTGRDKTISMPLLDGHTWGEMPQ